MKTPSSASARLQFRVFVLLALLVCAPLVIAGAPSNDAWDQPAMVSSLPFTAIEAAIEKATSFADPVDSVPSCAKLGNEHSVWYEVTAAKDGWIRVSTSGSDYDTVAWAVSSKP